MTLVYLWTRQADLHHGSVSKRMYARECGVRAYSRAVRQQVFFLLMAPS